MSIFNQNQKNIQPAKNTNSANLQNLAKQFGNNRVTDQQMPAHMHQRIRVEPSTVGY